MFGLFWHRVSNRKIPLVRGFDDLFLAPHSRHTEVAAEDIHNCDKLMVLAESDEAGVFLCMTLDGRQIFVMGHPEYDRVTLDTESGETRIKVFPSRFRRIIMRMTTLITGRFSCGAPMQTIFIPTG